MFNKLLSVFICKLVALIEVGIEPTMLVLNTNDLTFCLLNNQVAVCDYMVMLGGVEPAI